MDGINIKSLISGLANLAMVLVLAPFFEGLLRKITARIQSRQGPPIWQGYYDLLKLLGKEDIECGQCPGMQRMAAYLGLASILMAAWMIPMGLGAPLNDAGDVVLLIYILSLCAISTLLVGLAAGSTYSLMGISREMMTMITLEPLFVIALFIGAVKTQSLKLNNIFNGAIYDGAGIPISGLIMLGIMLLSFQAFVQRVPFDTAEAETELMEGPFMEYSGPKLALLKYARMAKLVVYSALFVSIFAPWGGGLPTPLNLVCFWGKVVVLVLLVTWISATHARYRIDQVLRYYALMLGIAMLALILATHGL